MMQQAKVHLVGAGPGDPELLTLKAARLIREADVVIYDRLVAPEILAMIPPGSTRIFVGKSTSNHTLPQDEINELLLRLAKPGRCVVRLKGGDPYVFGRGGEEAEYLVRHGVGCEVVPGVTAAAGCAAEFGIPLTHRGLATGVRFVTGHARENGALELDWQSLADPDTTLVVYMGLGTAGELSARLIAAGLPAATPCAAIANGTTAKRQICRTTLAELPQSLAAARLPSPVLLVIGRVAAMAELLAPDAATPRARAQARHA